MNRFIKLTIIFLAIITACITGCSTGKKAQCGCPNKQGLIGY